MRRHQLKEKLDRIESEHRTIQIICFAIICCLWFWYLGTIVWHPLKLIGYGLLGVLIGWLIT